MTKRNHSLTKRYATITSILLGIAIIFAILASLCIGAYPLSFSRAAYIVGHLFLPGSLPQETLEQIKELTVVQVVRLPRVLVATLAGMGLGMSGAALQGIMRNPLVGPDLVGVTSGAAFGGVLAMMFDYSPYGIVAMAFIFGLTAMVLTFGLAKLAHNSGNGMALILAGVFVGAFFIALVGLIQFVVTDAKLPGIVYWLLGSFIGADAQKVMMIGIPTLAGGAILMMLRWRINLLSLGDIDAASLGISVSKLRWGVIALVSLIVAAQVSVVGIIGWVGLVVPHLARMLVGPDHRRLLPASALIGGLFVLGLDDFTRTIVQAEVPVGILTALVGTPIVCFLFWKTQTKGWSE
ncbi:putative ABC transporter permease protein [Sulfurospirillum diekertiae]|uniref:ABC transporter permease protein n=1 Tax=Sulfurospirillum diekertiae TaxID=1854492 RepID=A0A290HTX1_9BACT|nr:iron ABC transporter permease [Sulfurospirillum diekertiae]ATB70074.1 putative ABC transporter permease protein [Sulfurospirillum diekertiae]